MKATKQSKRYIIIKILKLYAIISLLGFIICLGVTIFTPYEPRRTTVVAAVGLFFLISGNIVPMICPIIHNNSLPDNSLLIQGGPGTARSAVIYHCPKCKKPVCFGYDKNAYCNDCHCLIFDVSSKEMNNQD